MAQSIMSHEALLTRMRGEYLEMPGLRLTLAQAERLCGVERTLCKAVLDALVDAKFLCLKSDGAYARLIEGDVNSPALGHSRPRVHSNHSGLLPLRKRLLRGQAPPASNRGAD